MNLSSEQREFLRKFFHNNLKWIKEKDMLDPDDIKQLVELYSDYLENSKFCDNESLKLFLLQLKSTQLHELKIKKGEINLTRKEKILRLSVPASSAGLYKCKNNVIRKWYNESLIVRTITRADIAAINKSIEPKLKQNALERKLSWEAAKNIWVK